MKRDRATAPAHLFCLSLLAATCFALACHSRSPFSRPPDELAVDSPCTYMGTVHKESRVRIEALRACGSVDLDEWKCMAQVLKELDIHFTEACRSRSIDYQEISREQRRRFDACFSPPRTDVVECTPLDAEPDCLAEQCG